MKIFTITRSNNKEWHSANAELFINLETAVKEWNIVMLLHGAELWQVEDARQEIKETGFILFTYTDNFNRKWGFSLQKTKIKTS
tara:strand:- start:625 stop:876 length:252 start_codon:yes stop_codon:yes gene_type:complete